MFKRLVSLCVLSTFVLSSVMPNMAYAQALNLPAPGTMVGASEAFNPLLIKGLQVKPENPLLFDFIINTGDSGLKVGQDNAAIRTESEKLIKYFLASLTIAEKDQWVNLSPYEKDRIMTSDLEKTTFGRDMLAQDYLLKQVTSSLMYPEKDLGKKFWARVYEQVQAKFGNVEVPVDTFNKVWVVADKADVYVHDNAAFVAGSHLKVMLESDYLAASTEGSQALPSSQEGSSTQELAKQVVREIILPALEVEVNQGRNFAGLRQIFHAMILAAWYKKSLKEALLNQVYADRNKINGVGLDVSRGESQTRPVDPKQIYARYVEAFQKGVFNFIKEDTTPTGEIIPHRYFSGGLAIKAGEALEVSTGAQSAVKAADGLSSGETFAARTAFENASAAMATAIAGVPNVLNSLDFPPARKISDLPDIVRLTLFETRGAQLLPDDIGQATLANLNILLTARLARAIGQSVTLNAGEWVNVVPAKGSEHDLLVQEIVVNLMNQLEQTGMRVTASASASEPAVTVALGSSASWYAVTTREGKDITSNVRSHVLQVTSVTNNVLTPFTDNPAGQSVHPLNGVYASAAMKAGTSHIKAMKPGEMFLGGEVVQASFVEESLGNLENTLSIKGEASSMSAVVNGVWYNVPLQGEDVNGQIVRRQVRGLVVRELWTYLEQEKARSAEATSKSTGTNSPDLIKQWVAAKKAVAHQIADAQGPLAALRSALGLVTFSAEPEFRSVWREMVQSQLNASGARVVYIDAKDVNVENPYVANASGALLTGVPSPLGNNIAKVTFAAQGLTVYVLLDAAMATPMPGMPAPLAVAQQVAKVVKPAAKSVEQPVKAKAVPQDWKLEKGHLTREQLVAFLNGLQPQDAVGAVMVDLGTEIIGQDIVWVGIHKHVVQPSLGQQAERVLGKVVNKASHYSIYKTGEGLYSVVDAAMKAGSLAGRDLAPVLGTVLAQVQSQLNVPVQDENAGNLWLFSSTDPVERKVALRLMNNLALIGLQPKGKNVYYMVPARSGNDIGLNYYFAHSSATGYPSLEDMRQRLAQALKTAVIDISDNWLKDHLGYVFTGVPQEWKAPGKVERPGQEQAVFERMRSALAPRFSLFLREKFGLDMTSDEIMARMSMVSVGGAAFVHVSNASDTNAAMTAVQAIPSSEVIKEGEPLETSAAFMVPRSAKSKASGAPEGQWQMRLNKAGDEFLLTIAGLYRNQESGEQKEYGPIARLMFGSETTREDIKRAMDLLQSDAELLKLIHGGYYLLANSGATLGEQIAGRLNALLGLPGAASQDALSREDEDAAMQAVIGISDEKWHDFVNDTLPRVEINNGMPTILLNHLDQFYYANTFKDFILNAWRVRMEMEKAQSEDRFSVERYLDERESSNVPPSYEVAKFLSDSLAWVKFPHIGSTEYLTRSIREIQQSLMSPRTNRDILKAFLNQSSGTLKKIFFYIPSLPQSTSAAMAAKDWNAIAQWKVREVPVKSEGNTLRRFILSANRKAYAADVRVKREMKSGQYSASTTVTITDNEGKIYARESVDKDLLRPAENAKQILTWAEIAATFAPPLANAAMTEEMVRTGLKNMLLPSADAVKKINDDAFVVKILPGVVNVALATDVGIKYPSLKLAVAAIKQVEQELKSKITGAAAIRIENGTTYVEVTFVADAAMTGDRQRELQGQIKVLKEAISALDTSVDQRAEEHVIALKAQYQRGLDSLQKQLNELTDNDRAMKQSGQDALRGGIDMNAGKMTMNEKGQKIDMTLDPAMVAQFKRGDFTGLTPVILTITPITNIRPLLGLADGSVSGQVAKADGISVAVRRETEV